MRRSTKLLGVNWTAALRCLEMQLCRRRRLFQTTVRKSYKRRASAQSTDPKTRRDMPKSEVSRLDLAWLFMKQNRKALERSNSRPQTAFTVVEACI